MDEESATGTKAGLLRRLAALAYDLLLVIAVAFVATFAMLPLTGGEAILTSTQGPVGHLYHAVLLLAVFAYFGWCWTQSGQTLGMKAWRIRLEARTVGASTGPVRSSGSRSAPRWCGWPHSAAGIWQGPTGWSPAQVLPR